MTVLRSIIVLKQLETALTTLLSNRKAFVHFHRSLRKVRLKEILSAVLPISRGRQAAPPGSNDEPMNSLQIREICDTEYGEV